MSLLRYALLSGSLSMTALAAQEATDHVAKLSAADAVVRELARRQLTVAAAVPEDRIARLLGSADPDVVLAAARILRDRGALPDRLRPLARHDSPAVRRAVLAVAAPADVVRILREDLDPALRRAALFELEARGALTEELLRAALLAAQDTVAEAATRLVVFERSPFPIQVAEQTLAHPAARRRLLTWLAVRPRARSGPWLQKILGQKDLDPLERILAIQGLPPAWIDRKLGLEVLQASVAARAELTTRAAAAAARFPHELADRLVPAAVELLADNAANTDLLGCLARVSPVGEKMLFDKALAADSSLRREISHWLSARESKLVARFVAAALDGTDPFPAELVGLTGDLLRTNGVENKGRIAKVVQILEAGGKPAVAAFTVLIEAEVFRPAMAAYAEAGVLDDKARRLYRLFKLPPDRLPRDLFVRVFEGDDADAHIYAANALGRAPVDPVLEPTLLEFAMESKLPLLKAAASRALVLHGSEAAGRKVFRAQSSNPLIVDWLIEKPKPWSHELLLKARAGMTGEKAAHGAHYHRVLVALAKLGDRGAREELIEELPHLQPIELQEAQKLMGRYYKREDLNRLARKYLEPKVAKKGEELTLSIEDERRAELIDWFLSRKGLALEPLLLRLWETDANYEVRLVALRGLLSRDSQVLHARLDSLVTEPFDDEQEELAFEVVGSMTHPIPEKSLRLLAKIVLAAPLTDPAREVRLSIEQGYDSVRGAYPLLTPIANLLRRDTQVRPGAAFRAVAATIEPKRYALNRQRLGLFLAGISLRPELLSDLGPVLAELILRAPDGAPDFVGVAELVRGNRARAGGDFAQAAERYTRASRNFCRGVVPEHIQRAFLGDVDPLAGYHPYAALAAQASICRARVHFAAGKVAAGRQELRRARDLAEGDIRTIDEISQLRRAHR